MIKVHDGVEQQWRAAHGLVTPHGIDGEEHDVALAHGRINDCRLVRDFTASDQHSGEHQIFFRSEANDDARIFVLRWKREARYILQVFLDISFLFSGSALHWFYRLNVGAPLDDVRVSERSTSA